MKSNPVEITFLGTGTSQGVPMIGCDCRVCTSADPKDKRLRSSVLIRSSGKNVVIDTGPDFRQQMLREGIRELHGVVFTHEHKDHIGGLDDVRAFNYLMRAPMNVYASHEVQTAIKRDFHYAFAEDKYPGVPVLNLHTIDHDDFEVAGIRFTPITVYHHKMPVRAFRIGDFTYITDANYIPPESMEKIRGSRVLVINALKRQTHISHFTLEEALSIIAELKPERAYLTHISHQMGKHGDILRWVPDNVSPAYDGLIIRVQ